MENLLYIPFFGEEGSHIEYASDKEWVVTKPQGAVILFKRDTCLTKEMSYIDMRERKEGFGMIQTVRKKVKIFNGKKIEKTKLSCKTQLMVANTPD